MLLVAASVFTSTPATASCGSLDDCQRQVRKLNDELAAKNATIVGNENDISSLRAENKNGLALLLVVAALGLAWFIASYVERSRRRDVVEEQLAAEKRLTNVLTKLLKSAKASDDVLRQCAALLTSSTPPNGASRQLLDTLADLNARLDRLENVNERGRDA